MMQAAIKIKGLTKTFGKRLILEDINLDINKDEIFGIIGMSGSGKTTLLNTLIGYLEPEAGDVLFNSGKNFKSVFQYPRSVRRIFGFSTQIDSFYPKLTLWENLDHFGSLYDLKDRRRKQSINELLKTTELYDFKDMLAGNLSGGMAKRLSIACSMIHNPKILIMDEPTSDLDPILRRETWDLIKGIHELGTTVIVASHFLDEVEKICDSIGILGNKKLITSGNLKQIKKNYSAEQEIQLETLSGKYGWISKELSKRSKKLGIKRINERNNRLAIYSSDSLNTLKYMLNAVGKKKENILDISLDQPALSELFESISKDSRKK